jgi:hypothetical protein
VLFFKKITVTVFLIPVRNVLGGMPPEKNQENYADMQKKYNGG